MIQDSGNRRQFDSGAVRDIQEGKGRCDLLPLKEVAKFLHNDCILCNIENFVRTKDINCILDAITEFVFTKEWDEYTAVLEVAKHYEEGCKKYGERNWEKGIPLHCYVDSGVRHYLKWRRGDDDERHDRAFIWNMLGLIWTKENYPDLDDIEVKHEH